MKKVILSTAFLMGTVVFGYGQKSHSMKVPDAVQSAFKTKFPEATKVEWEKESADEWEAEFKWNGKEYSANFKSDGQWLETEYEIKKSEVPKSILAHLDAAYSDYDLEEVERVETADGWAYELEIEVNDEEWEVLVNEKGIIKQSQESEEEDED